MKKIFMIVISALFSCCNPNPISYEEIEDFDLERYMGTWYEVARLENRFQKNLTDVTAQYRLKEDGNVEVINSGYSSTKKKRTQSTATAYATEIPNLLKVSFFPLFKADYWVIYVDESYQTAIVTGGSKDLLWILARSPQIPRGELDRLIQIAQSNNLDTSGLIFN